MVLYLLIIFSVPPDADTLERYNLTLSQARTLRLAFIIPYATIWFVAFFGYERIKNYSKSISSSGDGKSLSVMAKGLFVLALSMPVTAILSTILTYVNRHHADWTQIFVLFNAYTDILIGMLAMTLLHKGAKSLAIYADADAARKPPYIITLALAMMGTAFVAFMINSQLLPSGPYSTHLVHNLSLVPLVLTIILPLLFIWYNGLQAAYYIVIYRRYVSGAIYRSALGYLASGVVFVILARITLRYLSSLSAAFSSWTLRYVLIALYGFLILMAIGFGLIAKGAQKLKKLEEA